MRIQDLHIVPEFKIQQMQTHPRSRTQARATLLETCLLFMVWPGQWAKEPSKMLTNQDGTLDKLESLAFIFASYFSYPVSIVLGPAACLALGQSLVFHLALNDIMVKALFLPFWIQAHVSNFWTQEPSSGNNFCKRGRDVCRHCCRPSAKAPRSVKFLWEGNMFLISREA